MRNFFQTVAHALEHQGGVLPLFTKTLTVLRREGTDGIRLRVNFLLKKAGLLKPEDTAITYLYRAPRRDASVEKTLEELEYQPTISVVMPVYNVDAKWLKLAYESLCQQWYTNWELCICDDASTNEKTIAVLEEIAAADKERVKALFSDVNENISATSNKALALASGEYVALMDHDDELTVDALYEVVKALQGERYDFVYSDEDKISESGEFVEPNFKPDFSPDFFLSQNYISHLGVIRRSLVEEVNGWTVGLEGAQDFDLYLKVLEKTDSIVHIPKVLYHWRKIPGSTAAEFSDKSYAQSAGRHSLELAMARRGISASVHNGIVSGTYQVKYEVVGEPLVSIIIPFRDKFKLLSNVLNSLLDKTDYENFEVICMDNGSQEQEIKLLRSYFTKRDQRIRFFDFGEPFNYSRINNVAVSEYAKGDFIVFLNNDIEVLTTDWVTRMLEHAQRDSVGAVGAKLMFETRGVQHAGIVLSHETTHCTLPVFQNLHAEDQRFSRLQSISNYSAVTAAMLMVKRADFDAVGGFDEDQLRVAYNDVDLCLKLLDEGKFNVLTPYVHALHFESLSRGYEIDIEQQNRHGKEQVALKRKNQRRFSQPDPFYNPNLTHDRIDFAPSLENSKRFIDALPQPFVETIRLRREYSALTKKQICVFAHFDAQATIEPRVIYFLEALSTFCDVVFVSTSANLKADELRKVESYVCRAIVKENVGYDFGSWKTGIDSLGEALGRANQLILCNDSVVGPVKPLDGFFSSWQASGADVFGVSDSHEIRYHLQSYFLGFDQDVVRSEAFQSFWKDYKIIKDKNRLVINAEIGLSQTLIGAGFKLDCMAPSSEVGYVNNLHVNWKRLVDDFQCPFIKLELLKHNPLGSDVSMLENVVSRDYPRELLEPLIALSEKATRASA